MEKRNAVIHLGFFAKNQPFMLHQGKIFYLDGI